jgi:regulatory protein
MADSRQSLRERSLRLLAQREHSRAELMRKLAGHAEVDEISAEIERLAELGLQSDARFAEAWVRSKAARHGLSRLRRDLAQRGIAQDLIDETLQHADLDDELARARAVWASRYTAPPADHREWARQARFLQSRGFSTGIISRLLKEVPDEFA